MKCKWMFIIERYISFYFFIYIEIYIKTSNDLEKNRIEAIRLLNYF